MLGVHARRDSADSPPARASRIEVDTWTHMLAISGLTVYLAELDGDTVGTASAMLFPTSPTTVSRRRSSKPWWLHPYRRRGVATSLLPRLLRDMRSAGCNKIQLLSHKRHSDDGAHRLYTSLGFEPEAEGFRLYLGRIPEAVEETRRQ